MLFLAAIGVSILINMGHEHRVRGSLVRHFLGQPYLAVGSLA